MVLPFRRHPNAHVDGIFPYLLGNVKRQRAEDEVITHAPLLRSEAALGLAEIIQQIVLV